MKLHRIILLSLCCGAYMLTPSAHADGNCSKKIGCAAKQCELDAQIDMARSQRSMRKLAMLKDLRSEADRCTDKPTDEKK